MSCSSESQAKRAVPPAPDVVCFSKIDWDDVWESNQELVRSLAQLGCRVLYVEPTVGRTPRRFALSDWKRVAQRLFHIAKQQARGLRQPMPGVWVWSPSVIPPYKAAIVGAVNIRLVAAGLRRAVRQLQVRDPLVISFNPSVVVRSQLSWLRPRGVAYICSHDLAAMSPGHQWLVSQEERFFEAADLVYLASETLWRTRAVGHHSRHLLPALPNLADYLQPLDEGRVALEVAELRPPVLGYIGAIHQWVDQELILAVARERPDWNIVLIGPRKVSTARLEGITNIRLIPLQRHEDLPYFLRHFSLGLVPYRLDAFAQSLRPTKVLEYLAMGLAVVATDLPELRPWKEWVRIAAPPMFVAAITHVLECDGPGQRVARREYAARHSAEHVAREMVSNLMRLGS